MKPLFALLAGIDRVRAGRVLPARRVVTPVVLQMEAVECGAAALAIILAYFGRRVPLPELRLACGISRDGGNAANLARAARSYGLQAQGRRLDLAELRRMKCPLILFWNFHHFVVLEGLGRHKAWLNDPACGRRCVRLDEFSRAYTGVALEFSPGSGFVKGGQASTLAGSVRSHLQGSGRDLAFVLLAGLLLAFCALALPLCAAFFVDHILIAGRQDWLLPLLLGLGATAVARALLSWLQQGQLLRLEMHLALRGAGDFFWHVLRLPMHFFSQRNAGDIAHRLAAHERIAGQLAGTLAGAIVHGVAMLLGALLMLYIDWRLALLVLALHGLNLLLFGLLAPRRREAARSVQQAQGRLAATTLGGLMKIESLKAGAGEAEFFQRWSAQLAILCDSARRLDLPARLQALAPGLVTGLLTVLILGLGGARVMAGELSLGMLVAMQSLMASFSQPIALWMASGGTLQQIAGDLARREDVMGAALDAQFASAPLAASPGARPISPQGAGSVTSSGAVPASSPGRGPGSLYGTAATAPVLQGALEVRELRFGYSPLAPPLIDGFSLRLEPGRRVALVGASGSGKSTIARLVMGQCQPWSGAILFDGLPRAALAPAVLHAGVAWVDQESSLFGASVRDNLCLWDQTLPEADLVQAARDACIEQVILGRRGGYDSMVLQGGANFSAGQAQRLELARALAGNPRLLVLDEATAAQDPLTEQEIDARLRQRGCACLIISHRLSAVRDCDEIIVLDHGRVVERGTHGELMALQAHYARLFALEWPCPA